jgi:hypothetical protein
VRCKTCHYSLKNLTGPPHRCPECGREFDPNDRDTFLAEKPRPLIGWRGLLISAAIAYPVTDFLLLPFGRYPVDMWRASTLQVAAFTALSSLVYWPFVFGIVVVAWLSVRAMVVRCATNDAIARD